MFDLYGFDPKLLTDNELFDKQVELTERKVMVMRLGRMESANQLDRWIQMIEFERRERATLQHWKKASPSPVVVESDPSLKDEPPVDVPVVDEKPTKVARPTRRTIRSKTPLLPSEGV